MTSEELKKAADDYIPSNIFDGQEPVRGYMCLTDFECELGAACGGNTVYPSLSDCLAHRRCVVGCGIVEVEVRAKKVILTPARDEEGAFDEEKQVFAIKNREDYIIEIEKQMAEKGDY